MTEEQTPGNAPTNSGKTPTGKAIGKKPAPTKKQNRQTVKQGAGLNKIKQDELLKWTVFVQPETKEAVSKAAHKAGTTVTDWVDSRLREAATAELTKKAQPPAKPEDLVADIVQQFADRMKADQAASAQAQAQLIQQQGDQIAKLAAAVENRPATLKEMLFGKVKKG